jgi:hypothetical protein
MVVNVPLAVALILAARLAVATTAAAQIANDEPPPAMIYHHENAIAQAQVRLPFKPHLRSRKSLILGITRIKAQKDGAGFLGGSSRNNHAFVRPHAGVSLQWPLGRTADLRFDAEGLFTFDGELPLLPRATTTFVWHTGGAR